MSSNYSTVGFNHSKVAFANCDKRIKYRMPPFHEPLILVSFMENDTLPCHEPLKQLAAVPNELGVVNG